MLQELQQRKKQHRKSTNNTPNQGKRSSVSKDLKGRGGRSDSIAVSREPRKLQTQRYKERQPPRKPTPSPKEVKGKNTTYISEGESIEQGRPNKKDTPRITGDAKVRPLAAG